jgi:hypothetical protein
MSTDQTAAASPVAITSAANIFRFDVDLRKRKNFCSGTFRHKHLKRLFSQLGCQK